VDIKNLTRAIIYRRLAVAEPDECKAALLPEHAAHCEAS
jgi:hypothetical protein